jgi:outer membrane immunogenic protein
VLANRGLLFVTGGLAIAGVSSSGLVTILCALCVPQSPLVQWGGSSSSTRTGYTIGGGFEYALTDHWTSKAEYLYYDLGNASHPLNLLINAGFSAPIPYLTLGSTVSSVRGSIVRMGINYKFGGDGFVR